MIHSKKWIFKNKIHQANLNVKKTVQKDKIKNPNWGFLLRTLAWYFLKDFSNLNIKPKIGLIMLSWKLLMATDFMNVAAHSVEFVRCIKVSFRTHPGKYCSGVSKLFSKNYHLRVFSLLTTKSKEYSPTGYPISISATKFSCLDKHLSFSVNLQKSQFVGIVESRAGNVLYPIAEDIAETKYVTIYN